MFHLCSKCRCVELRLTSACVSATWAVARRSNLQTVRITARIRQSATRHRRSAGRSVNGADVAPQLINTVRCAGVVHGEVFFASARKDLHKNRIGCVTCGNDKAARGGVGHQMRPMPLIRQYAVADTRGPGYRGCRTRRRAKDDIVIIVSGIIPKVAPPTRTTTSWVSSVAGRLPLLATSSTSCLPGLTSFNT